jgi:hypothetical protein
MRKLLSLLTVFLFMVLGTTAAHADSDTTFDATALDFAGLTGSGTITVDTTTLAITAFDLTWTDSGTIYTDAATCTDATPCLPGTNLTISGADLLFNFTGPAYVLSFYPGNTYGPGAPQLTLQTPGTPPPPTYTSGTLVAGIPSPMSPESKSSESRRTPSPNLPPLRS